MGKRKTDEEFKKEYYEKYPDSNVDITGKYVNTKTKIDCICKKCGHNWTATPNMLLRGRKCPKCAGKIKYTTKSFKEAYYKKYPDSNTEIIGKYVDNQTSIKCKCHICNYEWTTKPRNLFRGTGCRNCAQTKYNTETFKRVYYDKFPNSSVDIVGEYVASTTPIKCKCKVCNWEWNPIPSSILRGSNCPYCMKKSIVYTSESFKEIYYKKYPNSNIEIIGEYKDSHSTINCKCLSCGYEWSPRAKHLMTGHKCPKCAIDNLQILQPKTTNEFLAEYYNKYPESNITILGKYCGATSPIKCKCNICNYEWSPTPSNLLRGYRCPYCSGHIQYTTSLFIKKLNERYPLNNVIVCGEYTNGNENIKVKCGICHRLWETKARNLLRGRGCPYCVSAKTEKSLGTFLDSLGISHTSQKKFEDCRNINPLPFDYEINDERFTTFLLEYQGEQHERPIDWAGKGQEWAEEQLISVKSHDKIKYDYCEMTSRHLEYIWYYEEDKIQALINLLRKYIKPEYDLDKILANTKMNKTA